MIYGSWDTEWDRHNSLSYWANFCPFTNTPSNLLPPIPIHNNQNFETNMKNIPRDIILLYIHVYHTWRSYHMIYGSWNIRCNRQKFLSFWPIICSFSPWTTWKIKILTLKKTPEDIIILPISTINDSHMMYGSWDMERNRQLFVIRDRFFPFTPLRYGVQQIESFCHFGPLFALLSP